MLEMLTQAWPQEFCCIEQNSLLPLFHIEKLMGLPFEYIIHGIGSPTISEGSMLVLGLHNRLCGAPSSVLECRSTICLLRQLTCSSQW